MKTKSAYGPQNELTLTFTSDTIIGVTEEWMERVAQICYEDGLLNPGDTVMTVNCIGLEIGPEDDS